MRRFYILVTTLFILSIVVFMAMFVVLDKKKHGVAYYTVTQNGAVIGTVKIDTFVTDDKTIYKSTKELSGIPNERTVKTRITFNRKGALENYTAETITNGMHELLVAERTTPQSLATLSTYRGRFLYTSALPATRRTRIFDEESPITYATLVADYDFRKGRAQGMSAIIPVAPDLPLLRRIVTLMSIRDEYITIDARSVKTEYLIVKIRNYPQSGIWVAKADHSILRIELPQENLVFTRVAKPQPVAATTYQLSDQALTVRPAEIKGAVSLSGTFIAPQDGAAHPAAILIAGWDAQGRWAQGLFLSLGRYLAQHGICALVYDKRGIGSSSGDAEAATIADDTSDVEAAYDWLVAQKEVDRQRIAFISHTDGAYYALSAASHRPGAVQALVLITPAGIQPATDSATDTALIERGKRLGWSDEYRELITTSRRETMGATAAASHDRISLLGVKCFTGRMKEDTAALAAADARAVTCPVFLIDTKEDARPDDSLTTRLVDTFAAAGHSDHPMLVTGHTNFFFGTLRSDNQSRQYYETDAKILEAIEQWLNKKFALPPPTVEPSQPTTEPPLPAPK